VVSFKPKQDSSDLYFIEKSKLYKLSKQDQVHQITLVRLLTSNYSNVYGLACYYNSQIYYPNSNGPVVKVQVGALA
jgi:hypothetical protein